MRRRLAVFKAARVGAAFRNVVIFRRCARNLGEVRQRGLDLEPAILLQCAGNKGAAALPGFDDSIAGQQVDRLADGDTGDAEFYREFFIRWQPQALRPYSSGDTLAKDISDLGVFRTWLSEIKRPHVLGF